VSVGLNGERGCGQVVVSVGVNCERGCGQVVVSVGVSGERPGGVVVYVSRCWWTITDHNNTYYMQKRGEIKDINKDPNLPPFLIRAPIRC
jgi:hypothetical protein